MKCGNCKHSHETVAEVRECYGIVPSSTVSPRVSRATTSVRGGVTAVLPGYSADTTPGQSMDRLKLQRSHVTAGRYAVILQGDDHIRFYKIDKPEDGRWRGFTFIKQQVSDEFYRVKGVDRELKVLDAIMEDPETAMIMYGMKLGVCGVCGKTLTNPDSIANGIGPICMNKMGGK